MPTYSYKVKDKIVEVKFPMKFVGNEQELPEDILSKISYLSEDGSQRIIGKKIISTPALSGFDSNGSSTNVNG